MIAINIVINVLALATGLGLLAVLANDTRHRVTVAVAASSRIR